MIFQLFKYLIRFALKQFFSETVVRGTPYETGPALIVGNHQNLALDSMVISAPFKRDLWYLGKAALFKNPLKRWFLRSLHMAPLYRKKDNPEEMSRNAETFKEVATLLNNGRAVLLFPEGLSVGERKLLPIKTGAARMAFQAEEESGFKTGVVIQPAGLTYSDLELFRSSVTVVFGEPIQVAPFLERYKQDGQEAVRELTAAIEVGLRKVLVDIDDADHAKLVQKIAKLYRGEGKGTDDFQRFGVIAKNVEEIGPSNPVLKAEIEAELDRFSELCSVFRVEPDQPVTPARKSKTALALLLSPLVILGAAVFWIPYRSISKIVRSLWKGPVYFASAKFILGLVMFPLWAILLACIAGYLSASVCAGIGAFGLAIVSGMIANDFLPELRSFVLSKLWPGRKTPGVFLASERERLVARLESIRVA